METEQKFIIEDTNLVNYIGTEKNVIIPNNITEIEKNVFYMHKEIESVFLPKNLKYIRELAFSNCENLKTINFPNELLYIGEDAFLACDNLENITFPKSLETIGNYAFSNCDKLNQISIPNKIKKLNKTMFPSLDIICNLPKKDNIIYNKDKTTLIAVINYDRSLYEDFIIPQVLYIPNSVTKIEDYAFSDCQISNLKLPESLIEIGNKAFYNCNSLYEIVIPASTKIISPSAFDNCKNLSKIVVDPNNPYFISIDGILYNKSQTSLLKISPAKDGNYLIPNNILTIGKKSLRDNENLISLEVLNKLKTVEEEAFQNCINLDTIHFPDTIVEIEKKAFDNCSSLTEVTLPKSLNKIGIAPFSDCINFENIYIDSDNPFYKSQDGVLYNKELTSMVLYPNRSIYKYSNEINFNRIETTAFAYNKFIEEIELPDSCINIPEKSFYLCSNLHSIKLPEGLTSINKQLFANCFELTNIKLPNSITNIEEYAFHNCRSLTELYIPNTITYISNTAFLGCYNLTIYGDENSYSQEYAHKNNIKFKLISNINKKQKVVVIKKPNFSR